MAQVFLKEKSHKTVWENANGGLKKEIQSANKNRNKLAHYADDFDISEEYTTHEDGSITFTVSEPRLRPSRYNVISRLQGRAVVEFLLIAINLLLAYFETLPPP